MAILHSSVPLRSPGSLENLYRSFAMSASFFGCFSFLHKSLMLRSTALCWKRHRASGQDRFKGLRLSSSSVRLARSPVQALSRPADQLAEVDHADRVRFIPKKIQSARDRPHGLLWCFPDHEGAAFAVLAQLCRYGHLRAQHGTGNASSLAQYLERFPTDDCNPRRPAAGPDSVQPRAVTAQPALTTTHFSNRLPVTTR